MQGVTYLVAAYAIAWLGLFAYLAFLVMRIRGVRTELAAVTELVREQLARDNTQRHFSWQDDRPARTDTDTSEEL